MTAAYNRTMLRLSLLLTLLFTSGLHAQEPPRALQPDAVRAHLAFLADDLLE